MDRIKLRNLVSLAVSAVIIALVAYSVAWFLQFSSASPRDSDFSGVRSLRFFTNDSNILMALSCLIMIPFNIRALLRGRDDIPVWVMTLKMAATVAVTLTMAVVLVFLGPTQGYARSFGGVGLYLHLICPVLAIVSFCFLDRGFSFSRRRMLWGLLPTLVYGIIYLVNVVFLHHWNDFYGFYLGGLWYVSFLALIVLTCALALGLRALHNRYDR